MGAPTADFRFVAGYQRDAFRPAGSGYLDQSVYRSIHFHGARLADPLAEAAHYLRQVEKQDHRPPHVLCVHEQFSAEDDGSDLAWQVTLVLGEHTANLACGGERGHGD